MTTPPSSLSRRLARRPSPPWGNRFLQAPSGFLLYLLMNGFRELSKKILCFQYLQQNEFIIRGKVRNDRSSLFRVID